MVVTPRQQLDSVIENAKKNAGASMCSLLNHMQSLRAVQRDR